MIEYVVGFLFNDTLEFVAIIEKGKPNWQKGKLNGIGGKIEEGESPREAIFREFKEETGVEVPVWHKFCVLSGYEKFNSQTEELYRQFKVHFYKSHDTRLLNLCRTVTEEQIGIINTDLVHTYNVVPNLNWLIPMAKLDTYLEVFDSFTVNDGECRYISQDGRNLQEGQSKPLILKEL